MMEYQISPWNVPIYHVYYIGQGMVYNELKGKYQVICRSMVHPLTTYDNISEPIKAWNVKFNDSIHKILETTEIQ